MNSTKWQLDESEYAKDGLPALKAFIANLAKDPHIAEDILQETLIRTNKSANFNELNNPLAYMITVAKTVFYDIQRKAIPIDEDADTETLVAANDCLETQQLNQQKLAAIDTILQNMPALRRKVFVMRRLNGYSREQIARELDLSVEAVKKHVTRAMVDITLKLEDAGFGPDV